MLYEVITSSFLYFLYFCNTFFEAMAGLSTYNIAFKGLALGTHEFDFQIDKKFFDLFDGGIAEDGNVQAKVILEKQSALMVLWFHVSRITSYNVCYTKLLRIPFRPLLCPSIWLPLILIHLLITEH